jgi:hypothetical protein
MMRLAWQVCLCLTLICGCITIPAEADVVLQPVPTGSWGGAHIRLQVTEAGATIEYDCAFGTIDEPLRTDQDGHFEARGTHVFEHGGPYRLGEPPLTRHAALYRGWTDGRTMRLTVSLSDTGEEVGTFSVGLGRPPLLDKCL